MPTAPISLRFSASHVQGLFNMIARFRVIATLSHEPRCWFFNKLLPRCANYKKRSENAKKQKKRPMNRFHTPRRPLFMCGHRGSPGAGGGGGGRENPRGLTMNVVPGTCEDLERPDPGSTPGHAPGRPARGAGGRVSSAPGARRPSADTHTRVLYTRHTAHSLQWPRCRLCTQMPPPPHSLHPAPVALPPVRTGHGSCDDARGGKTH